MKMMRRTRRAAAWFDFVPRAKRGSLWIVEKRRRISQWRQLFDGGYALRVVPVREPSSGSDPVWHGP